MTFFPFARRRVMARFALVWGVTALLGACAQLPVPVPVASEPEAVPAPDVSKPAPTTALTAPVLYDILMGEIAGQRGEMQTSIPHYLRAAQQSDDPRIAERALRVAVFAKQPTAALEAARRWVALDADKHEARQVLAALALRAGFIDESMAHLEYLLENSAEGEARAYEQLSALMLRESETDNALELMEHLAARHGENPHAQLAYARVAAHAQQWDVALTAVDSALALAPRLTPAIVFRAQVLVQQEQLEQAVRGMAQAVAQQPDDSQLRLGYARLLVEARDIEAAREQFRILAKREPGNAAVQYSLALLALDAKQFDEAENYLLRLVKLGQKQQEAYYYLGQIAEIDGDAAKALKWYTRVEPGEQWPEVQMRMARIEASEGDLAQARERLQALREREPVQALRAYLVEGEIYSSLQMYQEAFDLYTRILQNDPENDDVLYARSLAAEKLDRVDVAEQDLRDILARNPDDARSLNALGYTLADRTDRYQEALGYIEKAVALMPDDPAILDSLGWVHYRLGNLQDARTYLEQAYELTRDAEIAAHLGEVLWMLGEREAARVIWNEGVEENADNPVLRATMKRLLP